MTTPKTAEDAKSQGYKLKKLTKKDADKLMNKSPPARAAAKRAAKTAARVVRTDCSEMSEGALCWEGNCEPSGFKDVLYCDGTQGCTVHARIRC